MTLRIARELTTTLVQEPSEVPTSEVLLRGTSTGKRITGAVLEAAVQWDDCYMLFMTDDVPFEEMLSIHLLDERLNLLDSVRIGSPYSTGSFAALALREPNTIDFRFIGDTMWSIELLSRPAFRLPFLVEPPGVTRPFGFFRHFIVRGNPRPQTA